MSSCQLDYILKELKSRNGEHACDMDLEKGEKHALIPRLEVGGHMVLIQSLGRDDKWLESRSSLGKVHL